MSNSWLSNQVKFSAIHVPVIVIATPFFRPDCTHILARLSSLFRSVCHLFSTAMDRIPAINGKLSENASFWGKIMFFQRVFI